SPARVNQITLRSLFVIIFGAHDHSDMIAFADPLDPLIRVCVQSHSAHGRAACGGAVAQSGSARLSVAVDIGGTFTDLVGFDERSGHVYQAKSLTTPHELSQGVWDCLQKAGIAPRDAENFVHGSTIAINIAIEQKGA